MYSYLQRRSIAPEPLLRGSLIQAFYPVGSERQLMEQLNLLFRWFVGLYRLGYSRTGRMWRGSCSAGCGRGWSG
jgi:transposase